MPFSCCISRLDTSNAQLFAFTVGTDQIYVAFDPPNDYVPNTDIEVEAEWTNDGGTDDNGLDIKLQIDYQTTNFGEAINGSHANSPRSIEDTYTSALGWILHETGGIDIPGSEMVGKHSLFMKISFVAPAGSALTSEPHLTGISIMYQAYLDKK